LPDTVTQGQFRKFFAKHHFITKGKKKNRYIGLINGAARVVTFHYHSDKKTIASGTLSAIARQLGMTKQELIDMIKER